VRNSCIVPVERTFFHFQIKSFKVLGITERRNAQITVLLLTVLFTPADNTFRIVH